MPCHGGNALPARARQGRCFMCASSTPARQHLCCALPSQALLLWSVYDAAPKLAPHVGVRCLDAALQIILQQAAGAQSDIGHVAALHHTEEIRRSNVCVCVAEAAKRGARIAVDPLERSSAPAADWARGARTRIGGAHILRRAPQITSRHPVCAPASKGTTERKQRLARSLEQPCLGSPRALGPTTRKSGVAL